jgi:hypothetical protein
MSRTLRWRVKYADAHTFTFIEPSTPLMQIAKGSPAQWS